MILLEIDVPHKRLKLRSSGDGHVKGLRSEEGLQIKQVKVVHIHQICQQLICQAVQRGHHRQCELPPPICGTIHKPKEAHKLFIKHISKTNKDNDCLSRQKLTLQSL